MKLVVIPERDRSEQIPKAQRRTLAPRHGQPWSDQEDQTLIDLVQLGYSTYKIALLLERTKHAIKQRCNRLI